MKYLILVLSLFALPAISMAQSVSITPLEWYFGNVLVGESASTLFRIESTDHYTPIEMGIITIEDNPFSAFSITQIDPIPDQLYWPEFRDIEVTFAPQAAGQFDSILHIETNDTFDNPPDGLVLRSLSGRGVVPEPSTLALLETYVLTLLGLGARRRKR